MADGPGTDVPDKKSFVLCFDGTGNKFEGKPTDSNILKIYRLLDRTQRSQFSWYNPGIGTYVQTSSLDHTTTIAKIRNWYIKAKDEAVGSSLGDHVMAGYKFLMRYYSPEDDIYIFGFSRGAYTARFLAEMLDHIGLLSAGNEELQRFTWKCFSKWQARPGGKSEAAKLKTKELYEYMKNFRETFCRPIRRIRFLGLFDTVNSVPRFESSWMQRTKFPYTAQSSAKVIRHAVSINERRAKFRVDLVSGSGASHSDDNIQGIHRYQSDLPSYLKPTEADEKRSHSPFQKRKSQPPPPPVINVEDTDTVNPQPRDQASAAPPKSLLNPTRPGMERGSSYYEPYITHSTEDLHTEYVRPQGRRRLRRRFSDLHRSQDILEVWFSGNHADIGGGWKKHPSETWQLSHAPLVWMVQEAEKAGLKFDPEKMVALNCCPDKIDDYGHRDEEHAKNFHDALHEASVQGYLHDCLEFGAGLPFTSVLSWKFMEYLPFRRMDLKGDGSWKPIRYPLPMGEVRDVPRDAKVHTSVLKRMASDATYRPGNLIGLGKGGRGRKHARKHEGTGDWVCIMNEGNVVSEVFQSKHWRDVEERGQADGTNEDQGDVYVDAEGDQGDQGDQGSGEATLNGVGH